MDPWNVDKVKNLQKIQNWSLRIVYSDIQPRLDETEMHVADCLATLTDRRISHLLSLMYQR